MWTTNKCDLPLTNVYESLPLSGRAVSPGFLWARWLFLRALGAIFLSAFYSLLFQIQGLVGERGILPARDYIETVRSAGVGLRRFWYVPSIFWTNASDAALTALWRYLLELDLVAEVGRDHGAAVAECRVGHRHLQRIGFEVSLADGQVDVVADGPGTVGQVLCIEPVAPGRGGDQPVFVCAGISAGCARAAAYRAA